MAVSLGEVVELRQGHFRHLEFHVEGRFRRVRIELHFATDLACPERTRLHIDVRDERLRKLFTVRKIRSDHLHAVEHDIDFRVVTEIAVMDLAIMDGEPIYFHWKKLFDLLHPRFVHSELTAGFARPIHKIHLRPIKFDLADDGAVPERHPFHGKIDRRRREKGHGHFPGRLFDRDLMNRISAAPEMKVDGGDMTAVILHFVESAVHVIAHPDREIEPDDQDGDEDHDQGPEPFSFPDPFHDGKRHRLVAPIGIRAPVVGWIGDARSRPRERS